MSSASENTPNRVIFAHRYEPEGDIEIILLAKGPAPGGSLAGKVVLAFGTN